MFPYQLTDESIIVFFPSVSSATAAGLPVSDGRRHHQQTEGESSLLEDDQAEEFWLKAPTEQPLLHMAAQNVHRHKQARAAVEICLLKGTLTTLPIHSASSSRDGKTVYNGSEIQKTHFFFW